MANEPTAPTEALERHFRHVEETRMADVPILNRGLRVQAVGFRESEFGGLGVLITPWFISLVLLPPDGEAWRDLHVGSKQTHVFPSGAYEFLVAEGEASGRFQTCSLLSPILEVGDQKAAIRIALAALDALNEPGFREGEPASEPRRTEDAEPAPALTEKLTQKPVSRRDFLRGRLFRPDPGPRE